MSHAPPRDIVWHFDRFFSVLPVPPMRCRDGLPERACICAPQLRQMTLPLNQYLSLLHFIYVAL
eukprot:5505820-Ditylum_brightwellii.AAC.1